MKPYADIAPMLGRGVIYDGTKTYTFCLQEMHQPKDAASVNITTWLRGSRIETVDSGSYPFKQAYTEMARLCGRFKPL